MFEIGTILFVLFPFCRYICSRIGLATMLSVVANVDDIVFDVEAALSQQLGTQALPFPGMDSKCFNVFCVKAIH